MQLDATQAIPMSMSEYFVAQYVLPWQCRRLCRCPLPSSVAVVAGAAAAAAAAESCVRTVRVSAFRAGAAAAVGAPTRQLDAPSLPATRSHCTSLSPAEDSPIIPPANAQMTPKAARGRVGGDLAKQQGRRDTAWRVHGEECSPDGASRGLLRARAWSATRALPRVA